MWARRHVGRIGWRVVVVPRQGRLGSGLAVSRCVPNRFLTDMGHYLVQLERGVEQREGRVGRCLCIQQVGKRRAVVVSGKAHERLVCM